MKENSVHSLVIDPSFLVTCIVVFLAVAFIFLLTILVSRVFKTYFDKRRDGLRDKLQRKLNVLILHEKPEQTNMSFPWNYHLNTMRKLILKKRDKQLMTDLIINNKQNLLGHSAIVLKKVYIRLRLKRFSMAKLSHPDSLIKIKGLQELAQMECEGALPLMKKMFYHRDKKVRQEVFTAMVRIAGSMPFSLITEYSEPIAGWMKVVIHKHLSAMQAHELPKFYEWMVSPNRAVKIFALELIKQFQQLEAIPTLASLLQDNDQDLAVMAAYVLGDLGAHQYADDIAALGTSNILYDSRSESIIRTLGKIGNEKHKQLLSFHMIHGQYPVRFEAIRALLKLKVPVLNQFTDFNIDHDSEFDQIYVHLTDPLLQ